MSAVLNLRDGLPPLPQRMRRLRVDVRGYPVPWFVAWVDGRPEFRAFDERKLILAVRSNLCWVCGERLGVHMSFLIGPMCIVNRTSAEPPSHTDCATFSAMACPFLSLPKAKRREANLPEGAREPAGEMIKRNPGVSAVWTCEQYSTFKAPGGPLFRIGHPSEVLWFAEGRPATREEVLASIESGLPLLQARAVQDGAEAMYALGQAVGHAMQWLPEAAPAESCSCA
jgi:hypothetical protein